MTGTGKKKCILGMEGTKLERLENQNGELGMGQSGEAVSLGERFLLELGGVGATV